MCAMRVEAAVLGHVSRSKISRLGEGRGADYVRLLSWSREARATCVRRCTVRGSRCNLIGVIDGEAVSLVLLRQLRRSGEDI